MCLNQVSNQLDVESARLPTDPGSSKRRNPFLNRLSSSSYQKIVRGKLKLHPFRSVSIYSFPLKWLNKCLYRLRRTQKLRPGHHHQRRVLSRFLVNQWVTVCINCINCFSGLGPGTEIFWFLMNAGLPWVATSWIGIETNFVWNWIELIFLCLGRIQCCMTCQAMGLQTSGRLPRPNLSRKWWHWMSYGVSCLLYDA